MELWKFQLIFIFHLYHLVNMDNRRYKVLVVLVFFMAIRHVMAVVAILQQLALYQHYGAMTMMFAVMAGKSGALRWPRSIWMCNCRTNFMENQLFGSYMVHLF
jgi:hypothetical protein